MKLYVPALTFFCFVFTLLINQNYLHAQDSLLVNNLQKHVELLASDSLEGRGLGTKGAEQAKNYIVNEYIKAGLVPFNGDFIHPFSFKCDLAQVAANNIIGMIEGSDPVLKNEYIVLGAHYDHLGWYDKKGEKIIYNGADDNASGVSGIIELARLIKDQDIQLRRTVLFIAFDAEESGLIGSSKFVEDSIIDISKVKCMFSIDMIGMYSKNGGLELNGFKSLVNAEDIVNRSLKLNDIEIRRFTEKIERRTDTAPFAFKRVPATHIFTGTKSPYHKPEDDADLLDYIGMAKIIEFMAVLTQQIDKEDILLPSYKLIVFFQKHEKGPSKLAWGLRFNTGFNNHTYSNTFFKSKSVLAVQTGIFAKFRLNEYFEIQPEILYSMGGGQSNNGIVNTHALSIPVYLLIGSSDLMQGRVYAICGGKYNYNISGSIGSEAIQFSNDYNRHAWDLSFGFGFEIVNVQMGLVINNGLSNVGINNNFGKTYENGLSFSMGYRF